MAALFSRRVATIAARTYHVGIIGAGGVGTSVASSLILGGAPRKITFYDINHERAEGEALDLNEQAYSKGMSVTAGPLRSLKDCELIVITAGSKMRPGITRDELLCNNGKMLRDMLQQLFPFQENTKLLLVSNPVDVLTGLAQKICEPYLPASQIIGAGTYLDTQRLRVALAKRLNIEPKSIHAYVVGEHGDMQMVPRSTIKIGGCCISKFGLSEKELTEIEQSTKKRAYEIVLRKGHTSHGVGQSVATICANILNDNHAVMPVSVFHPQFGTSLGWPCVLGRRGVLKLMPTDLTEEELKRLEASAGKMRATLERCYQQLHDHP